MSRRFDKTLPVELTAEELDERRDKLADFDLKVMHRMAELEAISEAFKTKKKNLVTRIDAAQTMCFSIAGEIKDRAAYKAVQCEVTLYHDETQAVTVRLDTGEIIDVRAMDDEEMQLTLGETPEKMIAEMKKAIKKYLVELKKGGTEVAITFDDE